MSSVTLMMDSVQPGGVSVPHREDIISHQTDGGSLKQETRNEINKWLLAKEMEFPPVGWQLTEIDVNYWSSNIGLFVSCSNRYLWGITYPSFDSLSVVLSVVLIFPNIRWTRFLDCGDYNNQLSFAKMIKVGFKFSHACDDMHLFI